MKEYPVDQREEIHEIMKTSGNMSGVPVIKKDGELKIKACKRSRGKMKTAKAVFWKKQEKKEE